MHVFYAVKYDVEAATLVGSFAKSRGSVREFLGARRMVSLIKTVCELDVCVSAVYFHMCIIKQTVNVTRINKCPLLIRLLLNLSLVDDFVHYFANDDIVDTPLHRYVLMCYADDCFYATANSRRWRHCVLWLCIRRLFVHL